MGTLCIHLFIYRLNTAEFFLEVLLLTYNSSRGIYIYSVSSVQSCNETGAVSYVASSAADYRYISIFTDGKYPVVDAVFARQVWVYRLVLDGL